MTNYYEVLGVRRGASAADIKKAFRQRAKRLHPDIAGEEAAAGMRKLLAAYQVLSDTERRFAYDRAFGRSGGQFDFDYRAFLRERRDDPVSQARLVFFELLHLEEDSAISVWDAWGGLDFPMEKHLDREDWMDCAFILAEELARRGRFYDAFVLLVRIVREERRRPYFRHFMAEVEAFLKELIRLRLRHAVDSETYAECLGALLGLGFSPRDEARWLRLMASSAAAARKQKGRCA